MTGARRLAVAALAAAALSAPATATAAAPRADLVDIEDEVMCVTCNVPLNIAEGPQPDSQRARIRELIAQGRTKPQIKQVLVAEYGEDVLALPESDGFGITAYAIPLALLALALAALLLLVPRWRRRAAGDVRGGEPAGGGALSDEDARRLDADLARYEA